MRLGFVDGELAAATHFGFDSTGSDFLIWAVGVSVEHRGHGLGREALDDVLASLTHTKRDEGLDADVFTRIWERNEPSQQLFAAAGFEEAGETGKPGLKLWARELSIDSDASES